MKRIMDETRANKQKNRVSEATEARLQCRLRPRKPHDDCSRRRSARLKALEGSNGKPSPGPIRPHQAPDDPGPSLFIEFILAVQLMHRENSLELSAPKREPSAPEREPSAPKGEPSPPEQELSAPQREPSAPEWEPSPPEWEPSPPKWEPSAPEWEPSAPEQELSAPKREHSPPEQEPSAPKGEPSAPEREPSAPKGQPSAPEREPSAPVGEPSGEPLCGRKSAKDRETPSKSGPLKKHPKGWTRWTKEEVKLVENKLLDYITSGRVPRKRPCEDCIRSAPEVFKHRTWRSVKYYIRDRIAAHQRKCQKRLRF